MTKVTYNIKSYSQNIIRITVFCKYFFTFHFKRKKRWKFTNFLKDWFALWNSIIYDLLIIYERNEKIKPFRTKICTNSNPWYFRYFLFSYSGSKQLWLLSDFSSFRYRERAQDSFQGCLTELRYHCLKTTHFRLAIQIQGNYL